MTSLSIIGCGFVADLYMRSLKLYPDVTVHSVFDRDHDRARAFCTHWKLDAPKPDLETFLADLPEAMLVLNLTNPVSHFAVSHACLSAGHPVYSEKPLALEMPQAQILVDLAQKRGLGLASAPCSVLSESAQMLAKAVREGVAGPVRLVYAELDDGFIPQAPYEDWVSESGAPWPYRDEFATGCTLEHAGYYLSWLIAMFGPVKTVTAAASEVIPDKPGGGQAPDFSVAVLGFTSGVTARLTCSIVAPHNHQIKVIGDKGVLAVKRAWDNSTAVRFHPRMRLRRRLIDLPVGRRLRPPRNTHPKVSRSGAASMNFALGPIEMLMAARESRQSRLTAEFALHLTEVTLAIHSAGGGAGIQHMVTSCAAPEPMPWAA